MVPFSEIVERIKDVISPDLKRRVLDKDVAKALGLAYGTLRTYKSSGYCPVDRVVRFCEEHNVSVDWMLFEPSFAPKPLTPSKKDTPSKPWA